MSLRRRSRGIMVIPPVESLEDVSTSSQFIPMDCDTTETLHMDQCTRSMSYARHSLSGDVARRHSQSPETDRLRFDSEESDPDELALTENAPTKSRDYAESNNLETKWSEERRNRSLGMVLRSGSQIRWIKRFIHSGQPGHCGRSSLSPLAANVSNNALQDQESPMVSGISRCWQNHKKAKNPRHSSTIVSISTATLSKTGRGGHLLNSNNNAAQRARRRSRSPPIWLKGRHHGDSGKYDNRQHYKRSPSGGKHYKRSPSGGKHYKRSPSGGKHYKRSPSGGKHYKRSPSGGKRYKRSPSGGKRNERKLQKVSPPGRDFRLRDMFMMTRSDDSGASDTDYSYTSSFAVTDHSGYHRPRRRSKKSRSHYSRRGHGIITKRRGFCARCVLSLFGAIRFMMMMVFWTGLKICRAGPWLFNEGPRGIYKLCVNGPRYVVQKYNQLSLRFEIITKPIEKAINWLIDHARKLVRLAIMADTWISSRDYRRYMRRLAILVVPLMLLAGGNRLYHSTCSFRYYFPGAPYHRTGPLKVTVGSGGGGSGSSSTGGSKAGSMAGNMAGAAYNLYEEVRNILQQLQSESGGGWLSRFDIETLVRGMMVPEIAALKAKMLTLEKSKGGEMSFQANTNADSMKRLQALEEHMASLVTKAKTLDQDITDARITFMDKLVKDQSKLSAETASMRETLANLQASLVERPDRGASSLNAGTRDFGEKMSKIISDVSQGGSDFANYLKRNFVDHNELNEALDTLTQEINAKIQSGSSRGAGSGSSSHYSSMSGGSGVVDTVRMIVEDALLKFSADKIGMPDYALESAGGSVINSRCSETYVKKTSVLSVFGIPLFYLSSSPRSVIQPEVLPGQCWAFTGSKGHMVIQLAVPIKPTAFTLEHIPKSLSIHGNIDTAPKDFTVIGLRSEHDANGVNLGNFTYQADSTPIQHFDVPLHNPGVFRFVELRVLSNRGSPDYTCLYRFRVHGLPQPK